MLDDLDGDYLRACRNAFAVWFGGGRDTLLLGRSAISALMRRSDWLDSAGAAFAALADGRAQSPLPLAIDGAGGTFHAKAASLTLDRPWVALKLNGNFPENRARHRLPTIQGAILLCDGADGRLLAILDFDRGDDTAHCRGDRTRRASSRPRGFGVGPDVRLRRPSAGPARRLARRSADRARLVLGQGRGQRPNLRQSDGPGCDE